jgi:hypothetical protein
MRDLRGRTTLVLKKMQRQAAMFLVALFLAASALYAQVSIAKAAEPVRLENSDAAVDLSSAIEIFVDQGPDFQVSAAPGADGIVRRIEIRAG